MLSHAASVHVLCTMCRAWPRTLLLQTLGGVQAVVASIHEAACVLVACLCDLSSQARASIAGRPGIVARLLDIVMTLEDTSITAAVSDTKGGRGDDDRGADGQGQREREMMISALGQLMQTSAPDTYVFQAAMHAMQSVQHQNSMRMAGGRQSVGDELSAERWALACSHVPRTRQAASL